MPAAVRRLMTSPKWILPDPESSAHWRAVLICSVVMGTPLAGIVGGVRGNGLPDERPFRCSDKEIAGKVAGEHDRGRPVAARATRPARIGGRETG